MPIYLQNQEFLPTFAADFKLLLMKKFLFLLAFMPLVLGGCEDKNGVQNDGKLYPVSGRTYIEEKYGGTELHFAEKGNSLLLVEHTEAKITLNTDQYFLMVEDTIFTYNNTQYNDVRSAFIYHDTYLTGYVSEDYRLIER